MRETVKRGDLKNNADYYYFFFAFFLRKGMRCTNEGWNMISGGEGNEENEGNVFVNEIKLVACKRAYTSRSCRHAQERGCFHTLYRHRRALFFFDNRLGSAGVIQV